MKRLINLLMLINSTVGVLVAQEWNWVVEVPAITTEGSYSGVLPSAMFLSVQSWSENQYVVAGIHQGEQLALGSNILINQGQTDAFISGLDESGNFSWALNLGGAGNEDITVMTDEEHNIYASLSFNSLSINIQGTILQNRGGSDICLIKFNPQRQVEWIRHIGTLGDEQGLQPILDPMGNILWVYSTKVGGLTEQVTVLQVNGDNEVLKERSIEVQALELVGAHLQAEGDLLHLYGSNKLSQTLDDGTFIPSSSTGGTGFILSLHADGTTAGVYTDERFWIVSSMTSIDRDVYFIGNYYEAFFDVPVTVPTLVKKDSTSTEVWSINMNSCPHPLGNFNDFGVSVTAAEGGKLYLSGSFGQETLCIQDRTLDNFELADTRYSTFCSMLFVSTFDTSGVVLSLQGYGDRLANLALVQSIGKRGELLVAGISQSDTLSLGAFELVNPMPVDTFRFGHSGYITRPFLSFIAAFGGNFPTPVTESSVAPLLLHPNPSQDHFFLRSEAFTENPVQIQILSTDGKLLSQQNLLPTGNSLRVEASALPQGMYVLGVIVDGQVAAERFIKH